MAMLMIGTDASTGAGLIMLPGAKFTIIPNNLTPQEAGRVLAAAPWDVVCDESGNASTELPDSLSQFGIEIRSSLPGWSTRATDYSRYFQGWPADSSITLGELLTTYEVTRPFTGDTSPTAASALLEQVRAAAASFLTEDPDHPGLYTIGSPS